MVDLIPSENLREWTGKYTKLGLKRWLGKRGISYWDDKNGWPITTLQAVNQALGVTEERIRPNLAALGRKDAAAESPSKAR